MTLVCCFQTSLLLGTHSLCPEFHIYQSSRFKPEVCFERFEREVEATRSNGNGHRLHRLLALGESTSGNWIFPGGKVVCDRKPCWNGHGCPGARRRKGDLRNDTVIQSALLVLVSIFPLRSALEASTRLDDCRSSRSLNKDSTSGTTCCWW
jgi:hypothetical protein